MSETILTDNWNGPGDANRKSFGTFSTDKDPASYKQTHIIDEASSVTCVAWLGLHYTLYGKPYPDCEEVHDIYKSMKSRKNNTINGGFKVYTPNQNTAYAKADFMPINYKFHDFKYAASLIASAVSLMTILVF